MTKAMVYLLWEVTVTPTKCSYWRYLGRSMKDVKAHFGFLVSHCSEALSQVYRTEDMLTSWLSAFLRTRSLYLAALMVHYWHLMRWVSGVLYVSFHGFVSMSTELQLSPESWKLYVLVIRCRNCTDGQGITVLQRLLKKQSPLSQFVGGSSRIVRLFGVKFSHFKTDRANAKVRKH